MKKQIRILLKSLASAFVIAVIISMVPFQAVCQEVQNDVFRLHILANSDSDTDQALKLKVRDEILKYTQQMYKNAGSKSEAIRLTDKHLQALADRAKGVVRDEGFDYCVTAQIADTFFDTRTYGNVTMPSGEYPALRIIIGEGKGHNWWCVMYPSLCVGASADYQALKKCTDDREYNLLTGEKRIYKFKIVEYYEKIKDFLT
ncbi:MAG: stage II sporulation protein R [Ruminococcus sp.]|nr:stage II sporulation protein R [Ruminococcus sp.]